MLPLVKDDDRYLPSVCCHSGSSCFDYWGWSTFLPFTGERCTRGEKGNLYSVIVLISFGITTLVVAFFGPTAEWSMWIFNNIQIPIETSLMALLVVILIFASIRLVRKRMSWFTLLFIGTALLMLLGSAPLFGVELPILHGPNGLRAINLPNSGYCRGTRLVIWRGAGDNCHGVADLDWKRSPIRGMMMSDLRCPMCGKKNSADQDYCKYCQARLKPLTCRI